MLKVRLRDKSKVQILTRTSEFRDLLYNKIEEVTSDPKETFGLVYSNIMDIFDFKIDGIEDYPSSEGKFQPGTMYVSDEVHKEIPSDLMIMVLECLYEMSNGPYKPRMYVNGKLKSNSFTSIIYTGEVPISLNEKLSLFKCFDNTDIMDLV